MAKQHHIMQQRLSEEPGTATHTYHQGVGARLLFAFLGISGFALLAAAAAMYAFWTNQEAFDRVSEQKLPAALASLEISRQSERIVAAAPALLTVRTPEEHEILSARIQDEVVQLKYLVDTIRTQTPGDTNANQDQTRLTLIQSVEELRANLKSLGTLVEERLDISAQRDVLVAQLIRTHADTVRLMDPWLQTTEASILKFQDVITIQASAHEVNTQAAVELTEAISAFRTLQNVQNATASINEQLLQSQTTQQPQRIKVAQFRLGKALHEVAVLNLMLHPKLQPLLAARINEYSRLALGEQSILDIRQRELDLLVPAEELLAKNVELSGALTASVDQLVNHAKEEINQARSHASLVQTISVSVLLAVVVLSLISSVLIVWRYVSRNLVKRLTRLSDNMLAIADGNLEVEIDDRGNDEIASMASALKVFRDTAVEVRETNLREIAEARRRLSDAIDSISEGFALFDRNDLLIIHNQRFVDLFPGLEKIVVEGVSFESIVQSPEYRGLLDNTQGTPEKQIAARLLRHQHPGPPFLQPYRDGRWIQISERSTSSEGTVAVYTDVTDVKHHEEIAHTAREDAENALSELRKAQHSLVQAEKLAQLGQLVAGIAHELKNPLNFVKNFAEVSAELIEELRALLYAQGKGPVSEAQKEAQELIDTIIENLARIQKHGLRADSIIKSMLAHSRGGARDWQAVDINRVVEESMNLAYHGARATNAGFNVSIELDLDENLGEIEVIPQDISRVLLNLLSNSFDAVEKRASQAGDPGYQQEVTITTYADRDSVQIVIKDNGCGMSPEVKEEIFTPFFTTKPAGSGTGLGLSLSFDIIHHEHGGEIDVESEEEVGTRFILRLPSHRKRLEPETMA